jgi:hypothetical protein
VQNPVVTVLVISGMGMGLLILALAFFYGLLALMASAIRDRRSAPLTPVESEGGPVEDESMLKAAAIAVALGRVSSEGTAEASIDSVGARPVPVPGVSAWWMLHHQRQLTPSSQHRRAE